MSEPLTIRAALKHPHGLQLGPCWEIQQDITADINAQRVLALRDRYHPAPY